jgi:hypothetical protein
MRVLAVGFILLLAEGGCREDKEFPADRFDFLFQGSITAATADYEFAIDPEKSPTVFQVESQRADVSASGVIRFTGGNCPGAACAIELTSLDAATEDFKLDKRAVESLTLRNKQAMTGTVAADGTIDIDRISVLVEISGKLDGKSQSAEFFPEDDVAGTIDVAASSMSLSGTLFRTGSPAD